MDEVRSPQVLFVYYTFTKQALKVTEDMESVFCDRGWGIERAEIEFTDRSLSRLGSSGSRSSIGISTSSVCFPRNCGERRARSASPRRPTAAQCDLVVIGSPTWWLTTCMRSARTSSRTRRRIPEGKDGCRVRRVAAVLEEQSQDCAGPLAERNGARCIGTTHFAYLGGQVRSLLSLISYLGTGEYQERYVGVKIPPTNVQPEGDEAAHAFARKLVDQLPK